MARFTIYSKDGQIKRYEGEPQYSGSYMGVDFVEFRTISSPTPIDWQIGDYVDYYRTGKRYRLYSLPMPKKVARKGEYGASFEYSNVQLYGATKELEIAPFRDLVPKDNKIHFSTRQDVSTYENVYGIARRIQECMDDIYPNKWRIEVYDTDDTDLLSLFEETKEYSVSGGSCLGALSQIYDTWKNVGWIHTYDSANKVDVITIGRANIRNADNTSDSFAHGVGKGLTSIKKASANKDEFATRLYIYGSERNIQTRYYNGLDILNKDSVDIRNLMLPIEKWGKTNGLPDASKAYLQADDSIIEKYGLIPRTVYFDGSQNEEIYPSIVGLTERRVRQAMINAGQSSSPNLPPDRDVRLDVVASVDFTKDSGDKTAVESNPTFKLYYGHLGFNLADQGRLTSEGYAVISMKSGACAGREFVVQSSEDTGDGYGLMYQIAVVKRTWDESLGMGFPNEIYPIKNGDEFVILDIPMPDYYITLAAEKLLSAGEKMLADYTRVSAFYEPAVDAIKIKEGGKLLQAGMFMQVYDEDIIDTADKKDYVLIDTLTIDEKSDLPIYRVTLREQKRSARTYSALEDMIEDARESNKQEISRVKQYTDRRFRSAQETLDMLQGAFENFSDGIDPVTIKTMATLVGDESLQYKFTSASNSLTDIACPLYYDETTKQMKSSSAYLKHMTLGIKEITTGALSASSYLTWRLPAWSSPMLEDAEQSYYVYIKAAKDGNASECLLSKTAIGMESVSGYYHFLVGILNSEHSGSRDFVTLYGFTEILPGQITTDILRSGNGKLIIDLARAIITAKEGAVIEGDIYIGTASKGLENLQEWSGKQQQINKAQSTADTAQTDATQAKKDAEAARSLANNAQSVANAASQRLNEWASDGIISPVEKQALKNELAVVNSDYEDIHKQYQKYIQEFDKFILTDGKYYVTEDGYIFNVEVANSNWSSFRSAYQSYVAELTLKTSTSESVEVGDLTNKQNAYYSARTAMLEDISLSIKAEADYSKKQANQAIQDASDARGIADTAKASVTTLGTRIDGVDKTIAEINNKLDGVVESYFDDYIPSKDNLPASDWVANGTEADHIGDTFTNTALNGDGAGQSWRWLEQADGSYNWQLIADSDAAKALALAGQAKAAADGKTKTFLVTPTNYNIGDIWIVGDTIPEGFAFKKGDILTTDSASVEYTASHWSRVINYNDEFQSTLNAKVGELNDAIDNVEQIANDYTDDARNALQDSINALNEAKANIQDVYDKTAADGLINASEQKVLLAAQNYATAAQKAAEETAKAYADGQITEAEQQILEDANLNLAEAKKELNAAIINMQTELQTLVSETSAELEQSIEDAKEAMQGYSDEGKAELEQAINQLERAKADLDSVYTKADSDKKISTAEQAAIQAAKDYADEQQALLDELLKAYADGKIEESEQKLIADAKERVEDAKRELEEAIDGVTTSVENVRQMASEAQSIANSARQELEVWANDSVISPVEKQGLKNELAFIEADYQDIYKNYQKYIQEFTEYILSDDRTYVTSDGFVFNIEVAYDNWETFDNAYDIYRADLRNKINTSGDVAIGKLEQYQSNFYSARTEMLDAISLAIKAETDYGVTNSDRAIEEVNKKANEIIGQLNEAEGQLRQAIQEAEGSANDYTNEVEQTLRTALKNLDAAKASVESVNAIVSEDGLISAAEERAIKEAEELAKAAEDAAKKAAEGYATEEGKKAIAEANKALETAKKELEEAIAEVEEIANLADAATDTLNTRIANVETNVEESVAEINARLDGVVENYYEEGAPALDKKPVTDWVAASKDDDYELINHVGDTYTNIEEYLDDTTTPDAGKSWRWCWCDDSSITDKIEVIDKEGVKRYLHWHPIADSDAVKALLEASKAQTTADGKSKNFVNEPTPPYKEGDLWIQGPNGDTWRCKDGVNRTSGSYDASEWELASKYTDDTVAKKALANADNAQSTANSAISKLNEWASDNVISPTEKEGLRTELAFILGDFNEIEKNYVKYIQEFDRLILQDGNQYITVDGFVFNVESANTNWQAYENAYLAYKSDLEAKTATNDTVAIGTLKETQTAYYNKRALVLEDITLAIKAEADYATEQSRAAKKEAEEAKEEIADYEYLKNALGKSLAVEGVVMSQMVAVADVENAEDVTDADVEAFLNGSDVAKDATHGKLIFAGGIPTTEDSGLASLEERAKNASTRIYEDGCTYTTKMHLKDGCTIGNIRVSTYEEEDDGELVEKGNLEVGTRVGFQDDIPEGFDGYVGVGEDGVRTQGVSEFGNFAEVEYGGSCRGYAMRITVGEKRGVCTLYDKDVGLELEAEGGYAHLVRSGMFAGLRPKIRIITDKSLYADFNLSEFDHTIIVNNSSAITITLPANPHEGQTYRLLHTTAANVTLNWNNKPAINVATGSTPNATFSARRTVVLTFCNNTWYAEYINLAS